MQCGSVSFYSRRLNRGHATTAQPRKKLFHRRPLLRAHHLLRGRSTPQSGGKFKLPAATKAQRLACKQEFARFALAPTYPCITTPILPPIASPDVALSRRRGDDFRNPPGKRHSVSSASRAISPLTPTPQPTWHYIGTAAYDPAPAGVKRNPCSLTSIREH